MPRCRTARRDRAARRASDRRRRRTRISGSPLREQTMRAPALNSHEDSNSSGRKRVRPVIFADDADWKPALSEFDSAQNFGAE